MVEPKNNLCRVILLPSGLRGEILQGIDLLEGARRLGVELESICGGRQTCGRCQIMVEEGHFPKHAITSAGSHVSAVEGREAAYWEKCERNGRRLACATHVLGDLLVTIPEES